MFKQSAHSPGPTAEEETLWFFHQVVYGGTGPLLGNFIKVISHFLSAQGGKGHFEISI